MAIITPFKKIFNWQLASEKIKEPAYKVFVGYVSVDDTDNMFIVKELENTIGPITFETPSTGNYYVKTSYTVPNRLNIVIPGFSDYWGNGNVTPLFDDYKVLMTPGYGNICNTPTCPTDTLVKIQVYDSTTNFVDWRTAFGNSTPTTSFPIEIRVYP